VFKDLDSSTVVKAEPKLLEKTFFYQVLHNFSTTNIEKKEDHTPVMTLVYYLIAFFT